MWRIPLVLVCLIQHVPFTEASKDAAFTIGADSTSAGNEVDYAGLTASIKSMLGMPADAKLPHKPKPSLLGMKKVSLGKSHRRQSQAHEQHDAGKTQEHLPDHVKARTASERDFVEDTPHASRPFEKAVPPSTVAPVIVAMAAIQTMAPASTAVVSTPAVEPTDLSPSTTVSTVPVSVPASATPAAATQAVPTVLPAETGTPATEVAPVTPSKPDAVAQAQAVTSPATAAPLTTSLPATAPAPVAAVHVPQPTVVVPESPALIPAAVTASTPTPVSVEATSAAPVTKASTSKNSTATEIPEPEIDELPMAKYIDAETTTVQVLHSTGQKPTAQQVSSAATTTTSASVVPVAAQVVIVAPRQVILSNASAVAQEPSETSNGSTTFVPPLAANAPIQNASRLEVANASNDLKTELREEVQREVKNEVVKIEANLVKAMINGSANATATKLALARLVDSGVPAVLVDQQEHLQLVSSSTKTVTPPLEKLTKAPLHFQEESSMGSRWRDEATGGSARPAPETSSEVDVPFLDPMPDFELNDARTSSPQHVATIATTTDAPVTVAGQAWSLVEWLRCKLFQRAAPAAAVATAAPRQLQEPQHSPAPGGSLAIAITEADTQRDKSEGITIEDPWVSMEAADRAAEQHLRATESAADARAARRDASQIADSMVAQGRKQVHISGVWNALEKQDEKVGSALDSLRGEVDLTLLGALDKAQDDSMSTLTAEVDGADAIADGQQPFNKPFAGVHIDPVMRDIQPHAAWEGMVTTDQEAQQAVKNNRALRRA
mmetsp:Transcript_31239/g.57125  ORF Transcript_31239/g.57125 Transcript_31239/m.57125 type:complete len:781 (+) Transcript_31239:76-2418(+)